MHYLNTGSGQLFGRGAVRVAGQRADGEAAQALQRRHDATALLASGAANCNNLAHCFLF